MSRKISYALEYSDFLKSELSRLEKGNTGEKQRFHNVQTAIAKIQSNPLNQDFNKNLPHNYKAADVLQQLELILYRFLNLIESLRRNYSNIYAMKQIIIVMRYSMN